MDEQEFDSLFQRPFTSKDAMRADARLRHNASLALALWGRTPDDLQRQLLAPHPEIPSGFNLANLRELLRSAHLISDVMNNPRFGWVSPSNSSAMFVGSQRFTVWEARCEVVRRAIAHLENR